jgi:hypothetical protein
MQVVVQVVCTPGPSLRKLIVGGKLLDEYGLSVSEQKRQGRSNGWAKVHSTEPNRFGALNIEWDSRTSILLCRVVTRREKPHRIVGDFADYLIRRFPKRIKSINIILR